MEQRKTVKLVNWLGEIVGPQNVKVDETTITEYSKDMTECMPSRPIAVVYADSILQIQGLLKLANKRGIPITPRVAGTNLGGLTIPKDKGVVLDLTRMDRILEINEDEMYAVIEPGVTWESLKKYLKDKSLDLTIGYPLSPPDTSVLINCLLDGLGNLSLRHGVMSDWINGLEVVLPNGEMLTTGAGSLGGPWFSTAPLPDLTGLFVNWQASTGIVVRGAVQLYPKPPFRKRLFIMFHKLTDGFRLYREFSRRGIASDIGGLSWPLGKMLFGITRPGPKDPEEPEFIVYMDIVAESEKAMAANVELLDSQLESLRQDGVQVADPLPIEDLVRLNSEFDKFSEFPTRLDFLLDHPGGGLTWVGTYGPMGKLAECAEAGFKAMARFGFPPALVSRPMKSGHFSVMRFITLFNQSDPEEVERVRKSNAAVVDGVMELGYIPYKSPAWLKERFVSRLDPGALDMMRKIKKMLDPKGIMNPGRWFEE